MESNSRFGQWMSSASEFLSEQAWFQQLKARWDELDPQSRLYLKAAGFVVSILLVIGVSGNFVWSVHRLKRELAEKTEILQSIQSANDELRRLKETTSGLAAAATAGGEPWGTYLGNVAGTAGIGKEAVTVSEEKKGAGSEQVKESLVDVTIKKVNIRQLVRYAYQLENGTRPVKLRNLLIDTHSDLTGYLDATLSVSAFSVVPAK